MTSIVGTIFITLPNAPQKAEEYNITLNKIVLEDSFIHCGPLILFLILFNIFSIGIKKKDPKSPKSIIKGYQKVILVSIVVSLAYLGYTNFSKVYNHDYFTLIFISTCIFVSSYQLYSNFLDR
jgi:hypothetical protein